MKAKTSPVIESFRPIVSGSLLNAPSRRAIES